MIETIRSLAQPDLLPMTEQFDVSAWVECDGIADKVRLNLESTPPSLVFECSIQAALDGSGVTVRNATQGELAAILSGLTERAS